MRKLTDVYIKVTKDNVKELMKQINRYDLEPNFYIYFISENIKGNCVSIVEPKSKQKVSLSQLKRLIDTIPTREEITRLKRQISAYKTNYDKAVKHSLSKDDVIEKLQRKLNRERSTITDLFKQRKEVQLNHCKQIRTLAQEVERVKNSNESTNVLNTNLTTENNNLRRINKELQKDNEKLTAENDNLKDLLKAYREDESDLLDSLIQSNNINAILQQEIKQIKQRKWYKFW